MKRILLLCIYLVPLFCFSQLTIEFSKIEDGKTKDPINGGKVSIGADKWIDKAKIIIQGEKDKLADIKLIGSDKKEIEPQDGGENKILFSLNKAFNNKIDLFEIVKGDAKLATVKFEIEGKKDQDKTEGDSEVEGYLGALTSANFVGNNKFLANLTPIVNLGGVMPLKTAGDWFAWELDANPYVGAEIDTKDSVSFIPSLMLYGRAGFVLNNYLSFSSGKVKFTFMPMGFGLKFLPNMKDSGITLIQHNLRIAVSMRYANSFLIGAQLTQGWHNLTSQSKKNYQKIFSNTKTNISYATIIGQFALKGKTEEVTNYVFFEWRGLISKEKYKAFENNTILTLGIRKTLELGLNTGYRPVKTGGGTGRNVRHHNL